MSKMKDKAIDAMNATNPRDDTFMELRAIFALARNEGTDLPLSVIGKLVATEVCKDQWEAKAIINAIQTEWEV
jgi:hypothetical protein